MRAAISSGLKLGAAAAAGLLLAGVVQSLHAQPASAPPAYVKDVPVVAPEVVRERVGRGRHGQPVEVAYLARSVSYADLDLTKPSDQKVLRDRVWATARTACRELGARTPLTLYQTPADAPCVGDAGRASQKIADQVIAAANTA